MKQFQKPSTTTVTGNGSITAGKVRIEFILSTDFVGTINGCAMTGANVEVYDMTAEPGESFSDIAYTISAGSAILTTF